MGIGSFSQSSRLSALLAPMQALAEWFVPEQHTANLFSAPAAGQRSLGHPDHLALPFSPEGSTGRRRAANAHSGAGKVGRTDLKSPAFRHLKVVRELDSAVSPACAGRMVISGRMADVCAELERMVQLERTPAGLPLR